ncbi:MAG: TetR/AcrR family transcriptional regulator [Cutibacterium avidum]|nr:TetR/AcrR family transcriptional regulator [Cutibacterium avidum]
MTHAGVQRISAKEKLLRVADREFYERGISATAINTLTDLAGVARMSLYKNFDSKDDVILEYLERRHREWKGFHAKRITAAASPLDCAMAVPYFYIDRAKARGDHFRGCGLLNAAGELQTNDMVRQRVLDIKARVLNAFVNDIEMAGVQDARELGGSLFLLLEGAMAHAGLAGTRAQLEQTVETIERFVERALNSGK